MYRIIIASLLLTAFGCDLFTESNESSYKYPLGVGYEWNYSHLLAAHNFRTQDENLDSSDYVFTQSFKTHAEIVRKEIISDSINTFVIRTTDDLEVYISYHEDYVNNQEDGLFKYAYRRGGGVSAVTPKRSNITTLTFNGKKFNSTKELVDYYSGNVHHDGLLHSDSLIILKDALQSIKYPLRVNSAWDYLKDPIPVKISKKCIGTVSLYGYNCYKIKWLYDFNSDGQWDDNVVMIDYISNRGLLKRTMDFKDAGITTEYGPEIIGYIDFSEEYTITDFNN
ncbi:MAG: hypothetical protein KJ799_04945 [Bacteroidetes bacterium]|nr:hypothetical protein [Bacteroidota bacterium]MBU1677943.1 hypothetical protein [Bacteroidota bacterium]MBU2506054.1 hypothetical protein [Bacteroidota bacterium]